MFNKVEFDEKLEHLDTRKGIIALHAVLEGHTIQEAIEKAERSEIWANIEDYIGIISKETI